MRTIAIGFTRGFSTTISTRVLAPLELASLKDKPRSDPASFWLRTVGCPLVRSPLAAGDLEDNVSESESATATDAGDAGLSKETLIRRMMSRKTTCHDHS